MYFSKNYTLNVYLIFIDMFTDVCNKFYAFEDFLTFSFDKLFRNSFIKEILNIFFNSLITVLFCIDIFKRAIPKFFLPA